MTVEKAIEAAKNRAKGEWETNRNSFESLEAELVKTDVQPDGKESYQIHVDALIIDTIDGDAGTEEMDLTVSFNDLGRPVFSNIKATLFREEDE
jgi:hypothetical protein